MEPFNIHCETCAAKLKVKSASAIGQKLACPKCGNMVAVVAPTGWKLEPNSVEINSENALTDSSDFEFEDVDHILDQNKQPKSKRLQRTTAANSAKPESVEKPQPVGSEPLLPNENWTANATRARRKRLIVGVGIVSLVLAASAVILAIAANRNSSSQVANAPQDLAAPKANGSIEKTLDNPSSESSSDQKTAGLEPNPTEPVASADDQPASAGNSKPAENEEATIDIEVEQPPIEPAQALETEKPAGDLPAELSNPEMPIKNQTPFGTPLDQSIQPNPVEIGNVQTKFDELSIALENSGTSLLEINQLATIDKTHRRVGLPKYFISKPAFNKDRSSSGIDFPIKGVQFENIRLTTVLAELSQMAGIPLSFDADSLEVIDFDYGINIEKTKLADTNFRNVIQHILKTIDKNLVLMGDAENNSSLIITVVASSNVISRTIDLPPLTNRTSDEFVELIKRLIATDSWNDESFDYKIEINNGQMHVQHTPETVDRIAQLATKWKLASTTTEPTANAAACQSKWQKSFKARSATLQISFKQDQFIMNFLSAVQQQTGVNVIVDFDSLLAEGWSQSTLIPFDVEESTVGELLDELAHSMNVAVRSINDDTLELLSIDAANERTDLEVYPCTKLLTGPLNSDQLVEIVRQALETSGESTRSRVYFAKDINSFVVVANQQVQRLIETVLNRVAQN